MTDGLRDFVEPELFEPRLATAAHPAKRALANNGARDLVSELCGQPASEGGLPSPHAVDFDLADEVFVGQGTGAEAALVGKR